MKHYKYLLHAIPINQIKSEISLHDPQIEDIIPT